MNKRLLAVILTILIAGALLALGGCREGTAGSTPAPAPLTQEELHEALLSVEDLPPGWTRDDEDGEDADAGEDNEQSAEPTTRFLGQELPDRSRFTVSAGFSGGDLGPFVTHAVSTYPAGQAAVTFAEQAEVIRSADPYTLTLSGGTTMAMEMWPLTFARLGADSVAVRSVSEDAPLFGTIYTDSVYVLVADAEAIIRVTGLALGGEAMNRDQMKALAQRSLEKLATVLEAR